MENFSAVGRLDLLKALYDKRCSWTSAVAEEIRIRDGVRPDLQDINDLWLGVPIDVDDPAVLQRIDLVRRALGGSNALPKHHLGEAQIIVYIETCEAGVLATDDRGAATMARNRGLEVIDTCDIVAACYESGLLACPAAYELLKRMAGFDRGVVVPDSHWQVCPPLT